MPLSCVCRRALIKQNPPKPTTPRKRPTEDPEPPGPFHYEVPDVIGGKGYSKIQRAPSYTFGLKTPLPGSKPAARPNAPLANIRSMVRKGGPYNIINGVMAARLDPRKPPEASPGPAAYEAKDKAVLRRAPAYTMQPPVHPDYQDTSVWTPGPNMYWPPVPGQRSPAYSFNGKDHKRVDSDIPGPGAHEPIDESQLKSTPKYTFGYRRDIITKGMNVAPPPNTYCQKKFNYPLKKGTAPSFGIRHSPFLGRPKEWLKSSEVDHIANDQE